MDNSAKEYDQIRSALLSERSDFEPVWRDIHDYIAPGTARFDNERVNDGRRKDRMIINNSPRHAWRTLASGMQSGLTSPTRPWFKLGLPDAQLQEVDSVKSWLSIVEKRMREYFSRSNLYDTLKNCYGTLGGYGTAAIFIEGDTEDVFRGYDLPMGSYMLGTDFAGRVNMLYRDVTMTSKQAMGRFKDKTPEQIKLAYKNNDHKTRYNFCHIVQENADYVTGSQRGSNKRWVAKWLFRGENGQTIVDTTGYNSKPFMAGRWELLGENTYGFGCGEVALGDCKGLQKLESRKFQALDKLVAPPMIADAGMKQQRTGWAPGSTLFANNLLTTSGKAAYPAYEVNPHLNEMRVEIDAVERRINEAFYKNMFTAILNLEDQPNITATQISAMKEERLSMLGPVLERLNDDVLDPLIDRVFSLMQERGLIPPAPKEIQGMPLKLEYISVLAQAQKAMGIGNIERFIGFIGGVAGMRPDILDGIDFDAVRTEYADGIAIPANILKARDAVDEVRQMRAEAEQQNAAMAQEEHSANVAATMSKADTGGDNALTRLAGLA